jgi:hypothetical protein
MSQDSGKSKSEGKRSQRLLGAVAVVLVVVAGGITWWNVGEQYRPIRAVTRSAGDFIVDWRCLGCGQTVTGAAGPGPKPCPKCQKGEMYACLHWSCPTHGVQPVAFQYDKKGDPIQIKLGGGAWVSYLDADGGYNIRCPTCNVRMMPAEASRSRE